uniref:Serine protease snake n=1 Tax=Sipha flava TaxID=143950 RepID=A0A2S2Q5K2_9HEMI
MHFNEYFQSAVFNIALFALCLFITSSQQTVKKLDLDEGVICRKSQGLEPDYVCSRPENCDSVKDLFKNQTYPDICSFDGLKPIICCVPGNGKTFLLNRTKIEDPIIAKEKCQQYSELLNKFSNGPSVTKFKQMKRNTDLNQMSSSSMNFSIATNLPPTTTIVDETTKQPSIPPNENVLFVVGGIVATLMEFPHMALLGYGLTAEENIWGCGGSLISERWILTAAHCQKMGLSTVARWARLGDLNTIVNTDNAQHKDYRIMEHVLHPDYKPPSLYNDIALFRLKEVVEFTSYIRPICLNFDPMLNPTVQIATGWGRTSTDGPTSADLLKVDLTTIPADQCNSSYFGTFGQKLKFGILNDSQMCAGSIDGGKDTCSGDSGGPLQIKNPEYVGMYTQIGITSFGKFCGDKDAPGVYTRVSKYISWIEKIVWPKI